MIGQNGNSKPNEVNGLVSTPTDDDRETLARLVFPIAAHATPGAFAYGIADRAILSGFRRSEVPEPSAEPKHDESCAEWCNHCQVCGEGILYGSRCREHYQNQPEPQGEPSEREVVSALEAWDEARAALAERGDAMYAALRAASSVTEQGEAENP